MAGVIAHSRAIVSNANARILVTFISVLLSLTAINRFFNSNHDVSPPWTTIAVTAITALRAAGSRQQRCKSCLFGNTAKLPIASPGLLFQVTPQAGSERTYFLDTLLIATTSRTTTSTPITVQIHIPPPIHPYAWFIIEPLSFRYDQPITPDLAREEYDFSSGRSWRRAVYPNATGRAIHTISVHRDVLRGCCLRIGDTIRLISSYRPPFLYLSSSSPRFSCACPL
jgi:hypothetical protein